MPGRTGDACLIQRTAIRGILLHRSSRSVLMINGMVPDTGEDLWMMPGGGLEQGETDHECLRREVFEETGLVVHPSQPLTPEPTWVRRHQFVFRGDRYDQTERYYLIAVDQFEPTIAHNPAQHELDTFLGFRWWAENEINEARATFVPHKLATHLDGVLTNSSTTPVDVSGP